MITAQSELLTSIAVVDRKLTRSAVVQLEGGCHRPEKDSAAQCSYLSIASWYAIAAALQDTRNLMLPLTWMNLVNSVTFEHSALAELLCLSVPVLLSQVS